MIQDHNQPQVISKSKMLKQPSLGCDVVAYGSMAIAF